MELIENTNYQAALEYISEHDLEELSPGRHYIDGDNLFVNIVDDELQPAEKACLEVHNRYIDIQIPLSASESFGIKPRKECLKPIGEFDDEKDYQLFADKDWETVTVPEGEAIVFAPDMAHAPLIGSGPIRKAVFKVKVD
ncbi:MAG: YhcH/YjgK/YiaL family protein [Bacteroidales bacterium]|nr:YhcH/YjgK/YiaL family protein [Bacteroidales bacterium]